MQGRKKWSSILFGAIFGLMAPILGIASLVTIFVLIGFNLDLGFPDDRVPDLVILVGLLFAAVALGIATALRRGNASREHSDFA
ncbi:MAG: hypothetical protein U5K76_01845 [Woeseiaceae bacterium]|nr:hypothetical protein [Woeseiaceae bacterium]